MRSVITVTMAVLLAAAGSGARAQATPKTTAGAMSAQGGAATTAPTTKTARSGRAASRKNGAAVSAKGTPAEGEAVKGSRRDPFESLVGRDKAQAEAAKNLPPGKAGLQVSTLRLDGIVRGPNGMIAVVANPQLRTYFLREGDQLYDGRVEKIAMDGVSFHEMGKDAFGKPVERQVNKRIYSSAGEQQ